MAHKPGDFVVAVRNVGATWRVWEPTYKVKRGERGVVMRVHDGGWSYDVAFQKHGVVKQVRASELARFRRWIDGR